MMEGVHVPFTSGLCSCGRTFEFETELMKHIDELMPQDTKKRQLDLFDAKERSPFSAKN